MHHGGYGLGVRALDPCSRSEFGWGGAAGAFVSVDPVNNVTIYYAQHLLMAPNRPLRIHTYDAVMADLQGEKFTYQKPTVPTDPKMTY